MTLKEIRLGEIIDTLQRLDLEADAAVYMKLGAFSFLVGDISAINHAVTLHVYDEEGGQVEVKVKHAETPFQEMFYAVQSMRLQITEMIRTHDTVRDYNERGALASEAERAVEALQALIGLLKLFDLAEHR